MPNITPELKSVGGEFALMTYRGYTLMPNRHQVSTVHIYDRTGHICTEHTDVALAVIDSWLCAP